MEIERKVIPALRKGKISSKELTLLEKGLAKILKTQSMSKYSLLLTAKL